MRAKGIRILDKKNRIVCVELPDILEEIHDGNLFHWSILYLEATGHLGEGRSIPVFEKQVNYSTDGLFITWDDLNHLSHKFFDLMNIILIGCKNQSLLLRYENDQVMYETCDIVIEMFDSCYWEVFSKDESLINRLAAKFQDIKFLESDFEK